MIDKFITSLFGTIVKGKQARAKDKLKNDPKLKKLYAKLDKDTTELKTYISKMEKGDKEFANLSKDVGSFLDKHSR